MGHSAFDEHLHSFALLSQSSLQLPAMQTPAFAPSEHSVRSSTGTWYVVDPSGHSATVHGLSSSSSHAGAPAMRLGAQPMKEPPAKATAVDAAKSQVAIPRRAMTNSSSSLVFKTFRSRAGVSRAFDGAKTLVRSRVAKDGSDGRRAMLWTQRSMSRSAKRSVRRGDVLSMRQEMGMKVFM